MFLAIAIVIVIVIVVVTVIAGGSEGVWGWTLRGEGGCDLWVVGCGRRLLAFGSGNFVMEEENYRRR